MKTLSIVGAGHVGKALGQLWTGAGMFRIQGILNRSPESAEAAAEFIGAGEPARDYAGLRRADIYLVATSDDAIRPCAEALARAGHLRPGAIVFHCSGALSSAELAVAPGIAVASVHPVKSFADPQAAAAGFAGTHCGVEGGGTALAVLVPAFERIGARCFAIDPARKIFYHAGSVFAANYLVSLLEAALRVYGQAGIDRATALGVIEPMVRGALDNVFNRGPAAALTGPVARGDAATVERQRQALLAWDRDMGELYSRLGAVAVELAREQGKARPADLDALAALLGREPRGG